MCVNAHCHGDGRLKERRQLVECKARTPLLPTPRNSNGSRPRSANYWCNCGRKTEVDVSRESVFTDRHDPNRTLPATVWNGRDVPVNSGSSPRAWGPLRHDPMNAAPRPVHPHVRGDHSRMTWGTSTSRGSSPRAWGPRDRGDRYPEPQRFIPTCVGTTGYTAGAVVVPAVHPHVRGDHQHIDPLGEDLFGSSPRAWGPRQRIVTGAG